MAKKRSRTIDPRSLRNLTQYKDMTDEEFEAKMELRDARQEDRELLKAESFKTISERAKEKIEEFKNDYDLTDLKYNDKEALDSLINATIMLEDFEKQIHKLQLDGIDINNLTLIDKINKMASDLRSDILKYQDSLMITRKIRKSGKEEDVLSYIDKLKQKAFEFYESKMNYIYCPKCKMLLSTVWFLYPNQKDNAIRLVCDRTLEDGDKCGTEVIVNSAELVNNFNKNVGEVPDF